MAWKNGDGSTYYNSYKPTKYIIGIDQSYSRTGFALNINGKIVKAWTTDFKNKCLDNKSQKRFEVKRILSKIIESCLRYTTPDDITIICERVRIYTQGDSFRPEVIKAQSALIAYIIDTGYEYGIRVYSVDTRAWKTRVLGNSKPVFEPIEGVTNPQKFGSVRKAIDLGFYDSIYIKLGNRSKREFELNDDMADAICIAKYGTSGKPYNLALEGK